ncbi:MAG TPA: hypothetical protein VKT71_09380 [Candidatus Acidoferrales bacterium]|nr:hypothetical protein [Candidatus Acidoferrales bacterium]
MSDKDYGIEFDRQAFVPPPDPAAGRASQTTKLILAMVAFAVIAFLGYELITRVARESASANDPALASLDVRLSGIESRLEKLEAAKKTAAPLRKEDAEPKADAAKPEAQSAAPAKPGVKTVYQVSFAQTQHPNGAPAAVAPADPDPAIARRMAALQQGLGNLESNEAANREAWQATTNRIADMAGQVGSQGADIVRSEGELQQLLARSEMEAIPFELLRGSNPQPVGPVSLVLKSSNPKKQLYTLCVYMQPSCIDLRDRALHEVVQFVVVRNGAPLEVIATKITKDGMLGYLEVPRNPSVR